MAKQQSFVIDTYCEKKYSYFGLDKLIIKAAQEPSLTLYLSLSTLVQGLLNAHLLTSASYDCYIEKLEQCDRYKLIGNFGKMKFLQTGASNGDGPSVVKESFKTLNVVLEVELFKKATSEDPILIPLHMFQNSLYVFAVYNFSSVACDVRSLQAEKLLSVYQSNFILFNTLKGLEFLHSQNIILRNFHASNVFIFENETKIGNFSCAILENTGCLLLEVNKVYPFCSPDYFFPNPVITCKTDIWAFGIFCCELWTGRLGSPFLLEADIGTPATSELMFKLQFTSKQIPIGNNLLEFFSDDQFRFARACLVPNFTFRTSAKTLLTFKAIQNKNVIFE